MEKKQTSDTDTQPLAANDTQQSQKEPQPIRRYRGRGKIPLKQYKVIVIYSPLTEEEARVKRAIIEGIIKEGYLK